MNLQRKFLALLLVACAVGVLYPGVTQPVLTLSGSIEKSRIAGLGIDLLADESDGGQSRQMLVALSSFLGLDQIEGRVEVYRSTRSIWETANSLARGGNLPVAMLIVLFSVVIPLFKLLLQTLCLLPLAGPARAWLLALNLRLSKWSMADVFVVALLVAYMAGEASGQTGDTLQMTARLEAGFYYFLAYCVFSIVAGRLLVTALTPEEAHV